MQIEKIEYKDFVEYGYYKGDEFIWHREDGPAVEYADGYKAWYFHGERHREDGPAIEDANGDKEYWINGEKIDGRKIKTICKIYKLSKVCK